MNGMKQQDFMRFYENMTIFPAFQTNIAVVVITLNLAKCRPIFHPAEIPKRSPEVPYANWT